MCDEYIFYFQSRGILKLIRSWSTNVKNFVVVLNVMSERGWQYAN
jgi:hypothetical protein